MQRVLALYIPFLSTDRLRNVHEGSGDSPPIATQILQGGVLRIAHVNASAHVLRIRPGQTLAEAKALAPQLVTFNDDAAADRDQLEALAVWANDLSPIVHIEGTNTLLLDVTGCQRLFRGERNLLIRAINGLEVLGFAARGAVADTPGAAWALSHAHREFAIVSTPGEAVADISLLPVWSLRIEQRTVSLLASVGVVTVASLLHLPRSSVASRFGDEVLERLDRATGDLPEVLTPHHPRPALTSRISLGAPTTRMDMFQEAIRCALEPFCDKLARKVAGVRHLFVTFYCPEVPTEAGSVKRRLTFPLNLSQATRSAKYLQALLFVLLEKIDLPAPAHALMLWAREVDLLDGWQEELFATDSVDRRRLDDLVNRLSVRLGARRVVRAEPVSDHLPERAFRYRSCVNTTTTHASSLLRPVAPSLNLSPPRPLRLLSQPHRINATAIVPEGPPVNFRHRAAPYTITDSIGPERIETGWWRGPHLKRDYYRVTTDAGSRAWLFRDRDTGDWFLHGWFD